MALATRMQVAGTSAERRRGLRQTAELAPGAGLWIAPCEAIHTFGLPWPIDAVFIDPRRRVCKVVGRLLPWRIAFCRRAAAVLELPAGTLRATGTQVGDLLAFHPTP